MESSGNQLHFTTLEVGQPMSNETAAAAAAALRELGLEVTVKRASDHLLAGNLPERTTNKLAVKHGIHSGEDLTKITFVKLWHMCVDLTAVLKFMAARKLRLADSNPAELLLDDLEDADLPVRPYNILVRHGVTSQAMVRALPDVVFDDMRNLGTKTLKKIRSLIS